MNGAIRVTIDGDVDLTERMSASFWDRFSAGGTNSNNMTFIYFRVSGAFPYGCDDSDMEVSLGDTWKIFVR